MRAGRTQSVTGALAVTISAATVLAGCFTTTADFGRDAEAFISEQVGPEVGATFQSVTCADPLDQDVGTRFTCSALDDEGGVWEFDNLIDAPNEFTVTISRRP